MADVNNVKGISVVIKSPSVVSKCIVVSSITGVVAGSCLAIVPELLILSIGSNQPLGAFVGGVV